MKNTITLKKNYEFKHVLTKGNVYHGSFINIYVIKEKAEINKIGIAVSKKTAKAVKRNRIKRWVREAYYLYENKLKNKCEIVIVLKKNTIIDELNFMKIKNDVEMLFKKAGII